VLTVTVTYRERFGVIMRHSRCSQLVTELRPHFIAYCDRHLAVLQRGVDNSTQHHLVFSLSRRLYIAAVFAKSTQLLRRRVRS